MAFFMSVALHGFFLLALSYKPPVQKPEKFGALMGKTQKGFEVFISRPASAGPEAVQDPSPSPAPSLPSSIAPELSSPAVNALTGPESAEERSSDTESKTALPPRDFAEGQTKNGPSPIPPSPDLPVGRKKGFLGSAQPAGNPYAAVPLAADFAMRRQAALSNIGPLLGFMGQMFPANEGVVCTTRPGLVECSNNDAPGLMGFLSTRYAEAHLIDPSLPAMRWRGHGQGRWSFELLH